MTDAQLAAILSALGVFLTALIGAAKWGVSRVVKSMDRATDAVIANTASNATVVATNATVVAKLEAFARRIDEFGDEISGVGPPPEPPRRTPAHGVRASTATEYRVPRGRRDE